VVRRGEQGGREVCLEISESFTGDNGFMPIGNSKWSTAKVKIALKTYGSQIPYTAWKLGPLS
jgi:hypothetical protein